MAVPRPGKGSSRALSGLTMAGAVVTTLITCQPALATSVDGNWANAMIDQRPSQGDQEAGHRHRGPAGGATDPEDDGARPQRSTPIKRRTSRRYQGARQVASLGRDSVPAHLPPLTLMQWARPKPASASPQDTTTHAHAPPPSVVEWSRPSVATILPGEKPKEVGPMVASLGHELVAPAPSAGESLAGDKIRWLPLASADCLAAPLRAVLAELTAAFGPMTVRWTCRNKQLNARVGGARRSYHLTGDAVDFNMGGNYRAIVAFLKGHKLVGGLKHYGNGAFHIDTGPRRTW
jgi:hypothetical protein